MLCELEAVYGCCRRLEVLKGGCGVRATPLGFESLRNAVVRRAAAITAKGFVVRRGGSGGCCERRSLMRGGSKAVRTGKRWVIEDDDARGHALVELCDMSSFSLNRADVGTTPTTDFVRIRATLSALTPPLTC